MLTDDWKSALFTLLSSGGTVLVTGGMDSGKTTFTLTLANACVAQKKTCAVIDLDPGQSELGPPTTLSMGMVDQPVDLLSNVITRHSFFLGSASPAGQLTYFTAGASCLVNHARALTPHIEAIDLPGVVDGLLGSVMLESIVCAVNPDYIVALSRGDELDSFLLPYRGMKRPAILNIKTTSQARRRSPEVRRTRRELKLAAYFADASPVNLPFAALGVTRAPLFRGKPLLPAALDSLAKALDAGVLYAEESPGTLTVLTENTPDRMRTMRLASQQAPDDVFVLPAAAFSGLLLGLVGENGQLVSLGIMDKFNPASGMARIHTPCRNPDSIRQIIIGSLRITPAGKELGLFRIRKIMTPRDAGT